MQPETIRQITLRCWDIHSQTRLPECVIYQPRGPGTNQNSTPFSPAPESTAECHRDHRDCLDSALLVKKDRHKWKWHEELLTGNLKALAKKPSKILHKWGPRGDLQKPDMSSALGGSAQPLSSSIKEAWSRGQAQRPAARKGKPVHSLPESWLRSEMGRG